MANKKEQEISLDDFSCVSVRAANGSVYQLRQTEKGGLFSGLELSLVNANAPTARAAHEDTDFELIPVNANAPTTAPTAAPAQAAMEIGDVATNGWYRIGTGYDLITTCSPSRTEEFPLIMSPPVMMTHGQAERASEGQNFRLPFGGELNQMYNALTKNPKALAAIAAGKIERLSGRPVWGYDGTVHGNPLTAACLLPDTGRLDYRNRYKAAETRFVLRASEFKR